MNTKEHLVELIEAFAAARTTANTLLTQNAASALVQFLESVELVPAEPTPSPEPEAAPLPPASDHLGVCSPAG